MIESDFFFYEWQTFYIFFSSPEAPCSTDVMVDAAQYVLLQPLSYPFIFVSLCMWYNSVLPVVFSLCTWCNSQCYQWVVAVACWQRKIPIWRNGNRWRRLSMRNMTTCCMGAHAREGGGHFMVYFLFVGFLVILGRKWYKNPIFRIRVVWMFAPNLRAELEKM